jgi:hypothetical protein
MEVEGKIKVIMDTQTFDSGFQKREFVITTKEQYPQDIKLECIKDRVELLDTVSPGDEVKASFNLRGNEYNGRYFVNLQAWKIDKEDTGNLTVNDINQEFQSSGEAEDDLPF